MVWTSFSVVFVGHCLEKSATGVAVKQQRKIEMQSVCRNIFDVAIRVARRSSVKVARVHHQMRVRFMPATHATRPHFGAAHVMAKMFCKAGYVNRTMHSASRIANIVTLQLEMLSVLGYLARRMIVLTFSMRAVLA